MTRAKLDFEQLKQLWARAGRRCERCRNDDEMLEPEYRCSPVGPEPPEWQDNPSNIVLLCAKCRRFVHHSLRLAAAEGWVVTRVQGIRWEGVAGVDVRTPDGWASLDDSWSKELTRAVG